MRTTRAGSTTGRLRSNSASTAAATTAPTTRSGPRSGKRSRGDRDAAAGHRPAAVASAAAIAGVATAGVPHRLHRLDRSHARVVVLDGRLVHRERRAPVLDEQLPRRHLPVDL